MDEPYTDGAVVVPKGAFAIFVWPDGRCEFVVPDLGNDMKAEVPEPFLAATMVAVKFMADSEWVQDMADEFANKRAS